MYVGKSSHWADEANPPTTTDIHTNHIDIWNHMAGAVRISRNEVALGIKTHSWASGVVYEKYEDSSASLGTGTGYYVLAGSNDRCVYKCLDNNGGDVTGSTVKPIHRYTTTYRELDGYVWKYMYEISMSDDLDFNSETATFVPIGKGISSGPGTILNIVVPANNTSGVGEYYRGTGFSNGMVGISLHSTANIATGITTACNQLDLRAEGGLSTTDDFYNNCSIMITSGRSSGTIRDIIDYSQSNKRVTLSSTIDYAEVGDFFKIGPKISIAGDGAGLTAIGDVNGFGNLTTITVGTIGSNYSNIESISIEGVYDKTGSTLDGSGASASIYIPPFGGHGANPASELQSKYAIIVGKLPVAGGSADGDGYFVGWGQGYRHVGLLRNPLTTDSVIARGKSYDLRTHLYFDSAQQAFLDLNTTFPASPPSVVTNANTGATGEVWNVTNQGANWHVTLVNVVANSGLTFSNGQYVSTPSGSAYISSANLDQFSYKGNPPVSSALPGQLDKYSGEIIYHEDIVPRYIHLGQHDNVQLIFEF